MAVDQADAELVNDGRGSEPTTGARSTSETALVVLLVAVGVLVPVIAAVGLHTVGIPQDDDWSFHQDAANFARTGHLSYDGWPSMTLVGQIPVSWPILRLFGDHVWVVTGRAVSYGAVSASSA